MKKKSVSHQIMTSVKFLFTIIAIVWLLHIVEWNTFVEKLTDLNIPTVIISFAIYSMFIVPCAIRWMTTAKVCGFNLKFRHAIYYYFVADFFSAFLPSYGCDFVRGFIAKKNYSVSYGKTMGTIFVERFCGVFVALCVGILSCSIAIKNLPDLKNILVPIIVIMVALFSVVVMCFIDFFRSIILRVTGWISFLNLKNFFTDVFCSLDICRKNRKVLVTVIIFSFINQMTMIVSGIILSSTIPGFEAPIISFFIVIPLLFFAGLIPSIGGYGVSQASTIVFFGLFGVDEQATAIYSIIRLIFGLAIASTGGIIFAIGNPFSFDEIFKRKDK